MYFKEITFTGSNAFGFEEVDGVRQHGIAHYLDLVGSGRIDLTGCSPTRSGSTSGATRSPRSPTQDESGAIKVAIDQR